MPLCRELEDEAPNGVRHRRAGRPGANGRLEELSPFGTAIEEELLLAREVVEDGDLRHVSRRGNVSDGHLIEPTLDEECRRNIRDALPGLALLALTDAVVGVDSDAHGESILDSSLSWI